MKEEEFLEPIKRKQDNEYTKLSYYNFLISTGLFILYFFLGLALPSKLTFIPILIFVLYSISSLSGLGFAIQSIRKKDTNSAQKIIGFIGNILLFLMTSGLIAYLVVDVMDHHVF